MGALLSALLVDDERNNLENLAFMLSNDCKGVVVSGMVENAAAARAWLTTQTPDVIFLDINMPGENGFELLESLSSYSFKVVFVTAYDQYAIRAIKSSALDYLLKPVSLDDLRKTIEKLKENPIRSADTRNLIEHLLQTVKTPVQKKIALPQLGGIVFIETADIVSLQADSNYTIIHMKNMQKMVITKTLKDFETLLDGSSFCRIHKSYIINLGHILEYSSADGGTVKMNDGNRWSISRRQLDLFLEKMKFSSLMFPKS